MLEGMIYPRFPIFFLINCTFKLIIVVQAMISIAVKVMRFHLELNLIHNLNDGTCDLVLGVR